MTDDEWRLEGVLLGTAVGDALGLPYEGMSRRRVERWLGDAPLRHRVAFGRGLVSDDTDHACLVALAHLESDGEPERFARRLARHLRWWLAALPAGVGFGTLRGIVKLWLGWSPSQSGVASAGNGPAMRAPLLGVVARFDPARRVALVRASTRITHRDARAEQGAQAVAAAAAGACVERDPDVERALVAAAAAAGDGELGSRIDVARRRLDASTAELVATWGNERGITGYVVDTVPAALHCWARNDGAAARAVPEIIRCGGDTDTTGAIVGALCGAARGASSIPAPWLDGIAEWPRSVRWMRALARALARGEEAPRAPLPLLVLRNAVFLAVVYAHVARRALPPY